MSNKAIGIVCFDVYRISLKDGFVSIWFQDSRMMVFPRESLDAFIFALEQLRQPFPEPPLITQEGNSDHE
jgi:hypothetical protein